jgi:hypothetical protein
MTDTDGTEALAKKRGSKQPRPQERVVALSLPEIREAPIPPRPCARSACAWAWRFAPAGSR